LSTWLGIVNPSSGGGGERRARRLRAELERWGIEAVFTERAGHATELARASHERAGLVVAGGDGTIFETLQGLQRGGPALRIVPLGRGNSLARDLGLYPLRFGSSAPESSPARDIDLLEVSFERQDGTRASVRCASTVAVGYPAELTARAARLRGLGKWSYVVAGVLVAPRRRRLRIRAGSGVPRERACTGLLISNTRHAASFEVFPRADCGDGRFEWSEFFFGRAGQLLHNVSALSGVPLHVPADHSTSDELALECDEPQDLLVDGELLPGVRSLAVRLLPGALRVCAGGRA
jgi:diacylglycerol kinase family enzyme